MRIPGLRYVIQFVVMMSDLALIVASAAVLVLAGASPFIWILVLMTYKVWHEQGGFMAWKSQNIRLFLRKAKEIGM